MQFDASRWLASPLIRSLRTLVLCPGVAGNASLVFSVELLLYFCQPVIGGVEKRDRNLRRDRCPSTLEEMCEDVNQARTVIFISAALKSSSPC